MTAADRAEVARMVRTEVSAQLLAMALRTLPATLAPMVPLVRVLRALAWLTGARP